MRADGAVEEQDVMKAARRDEGFEIGFDPVAKRLLLRLWGFWSEVTVEAFERELQAQIAKVSTVSAGFDTLSDASAFPVQSPAVATRFGALMQALGTARHGRIAVVVASTLNKMQAERSLGSERVKVFLDRSSACAWLDGAVS